MMSQPSNRERAPPNNMKSLILFSIFSATEVDLYMQYRESITHDDTMLRYTVKIKNIYYSTP